MIRQVRTVPSTRALEELPTSTRRRGEASSRFAQAITRKRKAALSQTASIASPFKVLVNYGL
jgi:hypothetical protein